MRFVRNFRPAYYFFKKKVDFLQIKLDSLRLIVWRRTCAPVEAACTGCTRRSILYDQEGVLYSLHKTPS